MTKKWPSFETRDLGDTPEDEAEMQRRWETYNREMQAIIAAGGVHQDADGWWVDDATGELIGPDPEIERPSTDAELAQARPFAEVFPELAASIRRRGPGRKPRKQVVTVRLDPDVVAAFKADGPGWQGRVNDALRKAKRLPVRAKERA
jgi:uncharacterized protein (DUF4415 family)